MGAHHQSQWNFDRSRLEGAQGGSNSPADSLPPTAESCRDINQGGGMGSLHSFTLTTRPAVRAYL
jgi:hypothetical protein